MEYGSIIIDSAVFMVRRVLKDIERGIYCFTDEGLITFISESYMENLTIQMEKYEALGEATANIIILMAQNLSCLQSRLRYLVPESCSPFYKEESEVYGFIRPKKSCFCEFMGQDRPRQLFIFKG